MRKYYFARIDGFLPVVELAPVDWYPFVRKVIDGVEVDHEGNRVYRGSVLASSESEAFALVRRLWKS